MDKVRINAMNWGKYADAVGDANPIHRFDTSARKYGLPAKIAPGMFIASFIQGDEPISAIKIIKFADSVFDGDELEVYRNSNRIRGDEYVFRREGDIVCQARGVEFGARSGSGKPLEEVLHVFNTEISQNRINLYLESIGHEGLVAVPGMFLASLSAPALLEYGAASGFTGIHASQSFTSHSAYRPGPIQIEIGDRKDKGPLSYFEMRAKQNGEIVASLRAATLPLDTN